MHWHINGAPSIFLELEHWCSRSTFSFQSESIIHVLGHVLTSRVGPSPFVHYVLSYSLTSASIQKILYRSILREITFVYPPPVPRQIHIFP